MIGIGKYKAYVDHMFFKGEAVFEIEYKDGKYEIEIDIDNADFDTDITVLQAQEDGNTLDAKASVGFMPGKEIDIRLTFDNGKCSGYLKIPFVGKIKIKDAVKI